MKNEYLKETFSTDKVTVSEVDVDALHKHISRDDAHVISEVVHTALVDMGIREPSIVAWDINVTVEQEVDK
jgi:hypothetical protein